MAHHHQSGKSPDMTDSCVESAAACTFTIFTPTYNRQATLERLFRSLERQSRSDFEWLVIDDGSIDATCDLIERLSREASFPVRYFHQQNAGKHAAFNRGVAEARGELFLNIDSDDELTPDALDVLHEAWLAIPEEQRSEFTGVTARCVDQNGEIVGAERLASPLDTDSATATFVLKMSGERIGFHRTDVLRRYPFPVDLPTRFIPEGRVWLAIAREFRTRFIETPVRIFHDHNEARLSGLDRSQRAWGDLEYYRFALTNFAGWWRKAPTEISKLAVGLRRAELHLDCRSNTSGMTLWARALAKAAFPFAAIVFARDVLSIEGKSGWRILVDRLLQDRRK